jgi:hypothetical protein
MRQYMDSYDSVVEHCDAFELACLSDSWRDHITSNPDTVVIYFDSLDRIDKDRSDMWEDDEGR